MNGNAQWSYVDHCPARAGLGFQSQAREAQARGCVPGFVPPMCDTTRRITGARTAAAQDVINIGSWQPLQPLAIVDIASNAAVTLDDLRVNGKSIFTEFDEQIGAAGVTLVPGLGPLAALTFEAIRSGANPFPPSPVTDQNNKLAIVLGGGAPADVFDFYVYFGNPAVAPGIALGNLQKNGGANYAG